MRYRILAALLLAIPLVLLNGCNTLAGAGKDVQKAGQSMENAGDGN